MYTRGRCHSLLFYTFVVDASCILVFEYVIDWAFVLNRENTIISSYQSFSLLTRHARTMRFTIIGFLVLVMCATVKAHMHFIRFALLCAMGLAGMWMMHKLAQDWQKISHRPAKAAATAGKLLGLWKRSIPDEVSES